VAVALVDLDQYDDLAFGVDENTALVVDGNSARAVGASGVLVFDERGATRNGRSAAAQPPYPPFKGLGSIVSHGSKPMIRIRLVLPPQRPEILRAPFRRSARDSRCSCCCNRLDPYCPLIRD